MAETIKNSEMNGTTPGIGSRMQSTVGNVSDKVTHVAQDVYGRVSGRFEGNRNLMYVGIGILAVGIGFGVWALIRSFREDTFESRDFATSGNYDRDFSGRNTSY